MKKIFPKIVPIIFLILLSTAPVKIYAAESDDGYFKDVYFERYSKYLMGKYYTEGDTESALELYQFILSGNCSKKQAEMILLGGYFCDEKTLALFKKLNVINKTFTLPKETQVLLSVDDLSELPLEVEEKDESEEREGEDIENDKTTSVEDEPKVPRYPSTSLLHDFGVLNDQILDEIKKLFEDEDENDAYINVPISSQSKFLSGELLSYAKKNNEKLRVNFHSVGDTSDVIYYWEFDNILFYDDSHLDLNVDLGDGYIRYNLMQELPLSATLGIKVDTPDTEYQLYDDLDQYIGTEKSNQDGYLVFTDVYRNDNFTFYQTNEDNHINIQEPVGIKVEEALAPEVKRSILPGAITLIILITAVTFFIISMRSFIKRLYRGCVTPKTKKKTKGIPKDYVSIRKRKRGCVCKKIKRFFGECKRNLTRYKKFVKKQVKKPFRHFRIN